MKRFWRRLMCVAAISVMFLAMTPGVYAENTDCSHLYETFTEEATCTNPGVSYDKCALCGKTANYANIPALGHSFGAWEVLEQATCADAGLEARQCDICGYREQRVQAAKGHCYSTSVLSATCIKQGYTQYTCSVCAGSYKTDYVDALGHSYESSVLSPTCTKQGYTQHTCSVCADSYKSDYVDALGHAYVSSVVLPTCEKQGYTHHACSLCGDRFKSDYVDASGHCYEAQVVAPTRTARGYTLYICNVCHDSYKADYVAATGSQTSANTEEAISQTTVPESTDPAPTVSGVADAPTAESTNSAEEESEQTNSGKSEFQTGTNINIQPQIRAERWYFDSIRWLPMGSADPVIPLFNGYHTRAGLVVFLWRSCGSPEPAGGFCPYADLSAEEEYYDAVLWAWEFGIARGIDTDRFSPETVPARRHVVSMLYWVFGEP